MTTHALSSASAVRIAVVVPNPAARSRRDFAAAVASKRKMLIRGGAQTNCPLFSVGVHSRRFPRACRAAASDDAVLLWDDLERKFVNSGAPTTLEDDPILHSLSISPKEVIKRINSARGKGGRLDLTGIGLTAVPAEVWELTDLVDLQLSNNRITSLPDAMGNLTALERLGLAGNRLRTLPSGIGGCASLEARPCTTNLSLSST